MRRTDAQKLVEHVVVEALKRLRLNTPFGPGRVYPEVVVEDGCFDPIVDYVQQVFSYEVGDAKQQVEQLLSQFYESDRVILVKPGDKAIQWLYGGQTDGDE